MNGYLGDFTTGVTVRGMWNSNGADGASITRSSNGTISVYKDGGTTQSTTGVTDTEDFDSLTGVHLVAIDTSADGTFYSAGSDFHVVLSAATIDTKTVNAFLFSFSLNNRSALRPTTAGRTLDVSATGEAGVDWANVGSPTTTVGLTGTTIATSQVVASVTGAVGSVTGAVGGSVAGNVTGSVGSLAAQAKADVNAEVLDVLNVDTFAQPGQETPAATTTLALMLRYLYKAWRNRLTTTSTAYSLYADDATTVDQKATQSDNGTTFDRGEIQAGP